MRSFKMIWQVHSKAQSRYCLLLLLLAVTLGKHSSSRPQLRIQDAGRCPLSFARYFVNHNLFSEGLKLVLVLPGPLGEDVMYFSNAENS